MTDREKVIYSIERCICHVPDACRDCASYEHPYRECVDMLLRDALELLKAQPEVVRCRDCKRRLECDYWIENGDDWFCADGKVSELGAQTDYRRLMNGYKSCK